MNFLDTIPKESGFYWFRRTKHSTPIVIEVKESVNQGLYISIFPFFFHKLHEEFPIAVFSDKLVPPPELE